MSLNGEQPVDFLLFQVNTDVRVLRSDDDQGPAITLMVVDQALGKKPSICPHNTGQGSEMFGNLRVALMRHGDTADPFGAGSFAKLSNLVALEVVNLMPDPVGDAGGQHEKV